MLAQDDLDSFARGKKKKNKTKVPTTTEDPTTTTTTTTTTTATTTSTTVTDPPKKNYQDSVLNEIFNKKEREDPQYESTTAISDAGQQQNEYNPPQQQINYDGNLNLVSQFSLAASPIKRTFFARSEWNRNQDDAPARF